MKIGRTRALENVFFVVSVYSSRLTVGGSEVDKLITRGVLRGTGSEETLRGIGSAEPFPGIGRGRSVTRNSSVERCAECYE